ncbi:MAG: hypothetical protein KDA89_07635 [Planctomycetaceae bacterium]|nr:hypothetical protein [Planctomycetaceae bacterium]
MRMFILIARAFFCIPLVSTLIAADRDPATLMPPGTIVYAEIPDPPRLLSTVFDHPLAEAVQETEPWKQATQRDGYRAFLAGRKFAEIQLGMDWRTALDTLAAKGISFGVHAESRGVVVVIRAKDAESLQLLREKLLAMNLLGPEKDRFRQGDHRGIPAWDNGKLKFAVKEDLLVITNKSATGTMVLDRLLDEGTATLADNPNFQAARETRPADTSVWAFADLATLREAGAAKKLFAGESENPAAELLFGGILSNLQHTPHAAASLSVTNGGLDLQLSVPGNSEWIPEERSFYFGPDGHGPAPALPDIRNTLFTLSAYRDISEMWLRAGDLFNERINDGIAEADANLTTLFAGRDFGEDILGAITPQVAFVASRQDFTDVLPAPAIRLPQFALVLKLRDPEKMTRELRRTFQSMIGFFNVLGAMQGNPQLELNMKQIDDAELITSTYIPEEDDADSADAGIFFNFSPSVGFNRDRFVVASTSRLAQELVQAQLRDTPADGVNTTMQLHADVLHDVLNDNRKHLVARNMLEDGNSPEEAEATIGLLLQFLSYYRDLSLELVNRNDRISVQVSLRLQETR